MPIDILFMTVNVYMYLKIFYFMIKYESITRKKHTKIVCYNNIFKEQN